MLRIPHFWRAEWLRTKFWKHFGYIFFTAWRIAVCEKHLAVNFRSQQGNLHSDISGIAQRRQAKALQEHEIQEYKAGILGICDAERKVSFCPDRVVII